MVLIILLILVPGYYVFFFLFERFSQLLITGNKWTRYVIWKKREKWLSVVPENIYSPHRSSLEICRGKGRKWGSEPEISALMGANVELACSDREKHICAFFVDDWEPKRKKSFLNALGFWQEQVSLFKPMAQAHCSPKRLWKDLEIFILMWISSPDLLIDCLFWQESCAIIISNNPFMTDKFCPLLIYLLLFNGCVATN